MAKNRTPTATLEASGAFIRHPERKAARALEPKPKGDIGPPPGSYDAEQKALWVEIAGDLSDGVAGAESRAAFGKMIRLEAEDRKGRLNCGEQGLLISLYSKFGMTPADRSKVKVSNDNAQDPLEDFLGQQPSRTVTQ